MIGLPLRPLVDATDAAIALLHLRPSIEDCGEAMLEQIAQAVRCDWGAYWALDPQARRLQAIATWSDTRVRTLAPHAGNAWHVWRTRKPIWATDLMLEMCLPRSLD